MTDRTTRVERACAAMKELRRKGVKLYTWGLVATRMGRLLFHNPRLCEVEAVSIAMYYEAADRVWVRAIVARAAEVAKGRHPHYHEHHTALMILRDLHYRTMRHDADIALPFGTPEEMIPG